jgi:hypothetical protein
VLENGFFAQSVMDSLNALGIVFLVVIGFAAITLEGLYSSWMFGAGGIGALFFCELV